MDRLVEKLSNGQASVLGCGKNCKYDYKYCDLEKEGACPTLSEIFQKLAYYEELEEKGQLQILEDDECDNEYTDEEYDYCYECGGYGDDYFINEDGELESNCPYCPFNPDRCDDDLDY